MAAILNLRLKGTADEIETLVARISALPGVELSAPDLKPARYGTGFLAYVPNEGALPNLDSFDGHVVDVTGVVLLHEGRPAIQLTSPDQIAFAGDSGRTPNCDDAS